MRDEDHLRQLSRLGSRGLAALGAIVLAATALPATAQSDSSCSITAFGARANDGADDTAALQTALDQCSSAGRRVVVPAGTFDIGHIRFPSGTDLYLTPNAVLAASLDLADYPPLAAYNGRRAWFYAEDAANIVISGLGLLDGQAAPVYRMMKEVIARDRDDPRADERVRWGILLQRCDNVRIRDVRMRDMQMFFMNVADCDNVLIDGIDMNAPVDSHNTDGIQITDSRDVRIVNCRIAVGDDAIVTKSRERPIERLMVDNCALTSDDAAIKFGTRSQSAVRDSRFSNITITDSRYGIALFMIHGGEYVGNSFSDISIATGGRHKRTYPIYVDIDDRVDDPAARQFGIIDGLTFSDIDIRTPGNVLIAGHPQSPIRNVSLSGIRIATAHGEQISSSDAKPRGNRRFETVPGSPDLAPVDATIVLGYAQGVTIDDVVVRGELVRSDFHIEAIEDLSGNTAPPNEPSI